MKTVLIDDNLHAEIKISSARKSIEVGKNYSITDYLNEIIKEHYRNNGIEIDINNSPES